MHIERSRFLLLATAIAAGACTINTENANQDAAAPANVPPSDSPASDAGTGGETSLTQDASEASSSQEASSEAGDAGSDVLKTQDSQVACDDSVGTPADCSNLTLSPCEEGYSTTLCYQAVAYLKPKVAIAVQDCLQKAATKDTGMCDASRVCVLDSLKNACHVPAAPECLEFANACNLLTGACLVDGFSEEVYRQQFLGCIVEGCTCSPEDSADKCQAEIVTGCFYAFQE